MHKTAQVSDIALGDELIEENGRPVQQIVAEMSQYALTSSHQAASVVAAMRLPASTEMSRPFIY